MVTSHWKGVKRQGKTVPVESPKIDLFINREHLALVLEAKARVCHGETVNGAPGFDPKPSPRSFKRARRTYTVSWLPRNAVPTLFQRVLAAA